MRGRLTRGRLVCLAALLVLGTGACGSGAEPKAADGLAARKVTAGEVTVTITPTRLDATGAVFSVAFDTHTVSLDLDVAGGSRLEVDGAGWAPAAWSGDGPGSHHRAGTLRFGATGPAQGLARLTIAGLPAPVEATWALPSQGGAR